MFSSFFKFETSFMRNFVFDLQRFASQTISAGESITIDGVTYTAIDGDAQLNLDDNGKVSGLASGKVQATVAGEDDSPIITFDATDGAITFDNATKKVSIAKDTEISFTKDGQVITFIAPEDISATYKFEEENNVLYFDIADDATAKISIASGEQTITGDLNFGGVINYKPETGTFGLVRAGGWYGDGTDTFVELVDSTGYGIKMASGDTTVIFVPTINDGKIEFNFPNETTNTMNFTLSKDGQTLFTNNIAVDGTLGFNPATQEFSLTKDTVLTITGLGENSLELTALDDASGKLTLMGEGIRFAPNAGDGALELNFLSTERKANLNITGAVVLGAGGKISLEDGTEVNIAWEDGANLKLISTGSTGSIGFGEKGLKITSDDEKLTMQLTMPYGYSTEISGLKGSLWYNAGKVILDEGTKLTGTSTLGSNEVDVTLETIDGDGYLDFSTSNGFVYGAGTGKLKVTYALGEKESTFIVNKGSVLLGNDISKIAEGTDLATDLKDFMPALNFITEDAGTYTINGQTITTSAANLALKATDNYMTFKTSNDVVEYDGMTFAGAGNVSLSPDNVVLGAGVKATGFGEGNSFVLAEAGNVTADARIFELSKIEGTPREIPMIITVTGAQDGFIFSRTLTKESEAYIDDALDEESFADYSSPYIDKVFTEKFISAGDNSYRIRTDAIGLEDVIGISENVTITGGATLDDEDTLSYYVLDTDTTGKFTIGKNVYTISDGSRLGTKIRARFEGDNAYADKVYDLDGTISGNFDGDTFFVNGSKSPILINGDDSVEVVGSSDGTKLFGVSGNATLASLGGVSEVHTDTEGAFWLAAKPVPFGVTVTGDDNVTFGFDAKGDLMTVEDLDGDIEFSKGTGGKLSINGIGIHSRGTVFSSIGAYENSLYIHDIERGTITAYEPEKVWLQMSGEAMTLNGNELTLTADSDGIWLRGKEIVGLDEGASLQVSEAGTYTANTAELEAKAGDIIVGLEGNDAYIYDEDRPPITRETSATELINHFKPNNSTVVDANASGRQNITLNGGDLAVVENTSAQVNITAGDDTIVSQGENVAVSLTGGNTWLFPLNGKMTLEGYDASTGAGFNFVGTNILAAIEDGTIDFNDGTLKFGAAQVDVGKSSELINFYNIVGDLQKVGYSSWNDSLDVSNETTDLVLVAKKYSTITGGTGDDTIFASRGSLVDGGAGSNLVSVSSDGRANIVFNGNTTVKGFHTGFGSGSDTVYISEDYPAVDFKAGVLTFYDDKNSLTFKDITTTAQINTYYAENGTTAKEVYIADDDWYDVTNGAADYYVGATAKMNHGIDFSGIKNDLNVTLNTDYASTMATFWINNIHSIKGGAGNTSITGSDKSDTIIAGTGATTIDGGAGDDKLTGNGGKTTFFFRAGDDYDTIENFEFLTADNQSSDVADKIVLPDDNAVTDVSRSGNDVILRINNADDYLTIENAVGKDFRINDLIAKVDRNIAYDGLANCYVAIGGSSLSVDSSVGSAEIWLDNSHGTLFLGSPIRTLDASAVQGNTSLVGNEYANTIIAGRGDSSLWGGSSAVHDFLVGGDSHNTFYYYQGNGNDVIAGVNDGDDVILGDITLDKISSTRITAGSVSINFIDGGSLTINGTADVTYQLADGSKYFAAEAVSNDFVDCYHAETSIEI